MLNFIFAPFVWLTSFLIIFGFYQTGSAYIKYSLKFPFEISLSNMSEDSKNELLSGFKKIGFGIILLFIEIYLYKKLN